MLKNRVVVITGASSGIGQSTAIKLQDQGYIVVWSSRHIQDDLRIQKLLKGRSVCQDVDVANEASVISLFGFVREHFGRLDALINCAGYVEPEGVFSTTLENWEKTITINLTGTFLCCKYASLLMKQNGGKIINIASTAGLTPRPGWSAYAAAKSGVINFSSAVAEELAAYDIKIFVICPGRTATPLRKILAPTEDPKSIMQPDTVADTIVFCLTDAANPIEGQPILVRERF
ncbi:SDR family NAD(P)-dependent oxidoreductase [Bacteroides fragilis]|jgi:hypothetical protein